VTFADIALNIACLAAAIGGVSYVLWVLRHSGADRGHDEARVRKLVATAPYHRLDNVLSKRG
jgi:hypothetical protein